MNEKRKETKILPFRPYIYDGAIVPVDKTVCPPYDVIDPALQDDLYSRSEYNVVRLEFGKEMEGDGDKNNKYSRSAGFFADWINKGILKEEKNDSIYVYKQRFEAEGTAYERTGFIALFALPSESGKNKGSIFGHEKTLSRPKEDRFKLMEATFANFSPIFSIFEDEDHNVFDMLAGAVKDGAASKIFDFKDDHGIENILYRISDEALIGSLQDAMEEKPVYIADGHHRFETCVNFRDYVSQKGIPGVNAGYCMMYFAPSGQEGLIILPTHRCVVNRDINLDSFIKALNEDFEIKECVPESLSDETREAGEKSVSFGFAHNSGRTFVLSFKHGDKYETPLDRLDVSILQSYILKKVLGITQEDIDNQTYLKYEKNWDNALKNLKAGGISGAFFMNPTKIEDVIDIASRNLRMPQKSTFFYPKIITGLTINGLRPRS